MLWLNSTATNHQRTRHRSQSLPDIVVAMNASLKYNAVILPQGRKAGERNKKIVSEKAVHASPEPRVNFAGRINNSACHRGAWDMWPTCLCKQRLTAVACLLRSRLAVYIVRVLKMFCDSRHLKLKFTHSKVVTPALVFAQSTNQRICHRSTAQTGAVHISYSHTQTTVATLRGAQTIVNEVVQLSKGNLAHTMS